MSERRQARARGQNGMTEGGAPPELLGPFCDHAVWQAKESTVEWFAGRGLRLPATDKLVDPVRRRDAAVRVWAQHTECSTEQLRQLGIRARTLAIERPRYLATVPQ